MTDGSLTSTARLAPAKRSHMAGVLPSVGRFPFGLTSHGVVTHQVSGKTYTAEWRLLTGRLIRGRRSPPRVLVWHPELGSREIQHRGGDPATSAFRLLDELLRPGLTFWWGS